MPARYLAAIDVGSTMIKAALLTVDQTTTQQQHLQSWVMPRLQFETTIQELLSQITAWITKRDTKAELEIALVGHTPETPALAAAGWRISHEEAIISVTKRLSSTSAVVVVDIGSQRTLVALGKYGKVSVESFNYGVGIESWNFLRQQQRLQAVSNWIPQTVTDSEVEDYFANKSLYPELLPQSQAELSKEQALARVILQQITTELPFPWEEVKSLVVTGAVLSQPPFIGQTVGTILDGLAPLGIVHLVTDPQLCLLALGGAFEAWSAKEYQVGRSILHQSLVSLGTVVGLSVPAGSAHHKLAKIILDTGLADEQALEVRVGDLVQLPLPHQDQATITINTGHNRSLAATDQAHPTVGGEAGLIIDGRGRPIVLADAENERRAQLLLWDQQLNAHHQHGIIGEAG